MYELCIYNARIMDPASGTDRIGAVTVRDKKIAYIGTEKQEAEQMIDAGGAVLAPGFIDIHAHEDDYSDLTHALLPAQMAESSLKTGVTTIVTGNCGMSSPDIAEYYKGAADAGLPINCRTLMGNCTLRRLVGLGAYDKASGEQIQEMCRLLEKALEEGAVGISFGLQYDPGTCYEEELALCRVIKEYDRIATFHMRWDFPEKAKETLGEMFALEKDTQVRMELSHIAANLYGEGVMAYTERAIRESGGDISCDMYPCNAWATTLQSAVFDDGFENFNFSVEDVEILTGEHAGEYCTPELYEELRKSPVPVRVACHNAMPMEDVEAAYKLPYCMMGSDGQMRKTPDGHLLGHPRGAGSPARILGEFVREKKLFSLMEGLKKMTSLPAERFGLAGKGKIAEGADADLVLFDPDTIEDMARFGVDVCGIPPKGIYLVIVGGKVSYRTEG